MGTSSETNRLRKLASAAALAAALTVGVAGVAAAETAPDQHSGGVSGGNQSRDPGSEVLGVTQTRANTSRGALPFTGADIAGLTAIGAAAVGVGATAVATSRRRAQRATA